MSYNSFCYIWFRYIIVHYIRFLFGYIRFVISYSVIPKSVISNSLRPGPLSYEPCSSILYVWQATAEILLSVNPIFHSNKPKFWVVTTESDQFFTTIFTNDFLTLSGLWCQYNSAFTMCRCVVHLGIGGIGLLTQPVIVWPPTTLYYLAPIWIL